MTLDLSMVDPESVLLTAIRDRLRLAVDEGGVGYTDHECEVEHDEMAPATAGPLFVIVCPNGIEPGSQHSPASRIEHWVVQCEVVVCLRVEHMARDRLRNKYATQLRQLNQHVRNIVLSMGDGYEILQTANLALEEAGESGRFVEPAEFRSIEAKPRLAGGELFGESSSPRAVLVRAIQFGNASFMRKW